MLHVSKITAITLDLDDTLWPIWPTIERAEKALHDWLVAHAPMTSALFANPVALREIREEMVTLRPDLRHDLSALRRESIRLALARAGDDASMADVAFEVFFAERQRVELFDDATEALEFLAARFPVVAVSNGNADLQRVGLQRYFKGGLSAREFGVGKPDPRIFVAAAGMAQVRPEQVLHVGDDASLDALGAMNAGMQAAWLNRGDHPWPHEGAPHVTVGNLQELCALLGAHRG